MPIYRAGTLLIPSGPSHDPDLKHLHVVCNDTDDDGNNLIVPVASWTNDLCDDTCILLPHEHDFVRHKSWWFIGTAQLLQPRVWNAGL